MQSPTRKLIADADDAELTYFTRELCEDVLAHNPDDGCVLEAYARILSSLALYSEAYPAINRAEQLAPQSRRKWIISRKGSILECQGKFREAENCFLEAHRLDSSEATFLIFAAGCAFRRGDIAQA